MTTIHKFWKNKNLEISTAAILIVAGILAVLGRDAAFYNSMTDILFFCSEASRVIVGSLMFPLVAIVIFALVKDVRKKLLSVVCFKVISDIIMIPFGININFHSDVFISDLSGLFFIAADFILLISLLNEKIEKAVCGGVLSAVVIMSLFTVAISSKNGDATIYIYRTLSTVLFYISVFYGSFKLPVVKVHTGIRAELKHRVKKEKEKAKLVTLLFLTAVCACTTAFFVMMSSKNIYIPNEKVVELTCYISWCVLFLFVSRLITSHINNFTTVKNIITTLCVAVVSTLQVVILNSYGHLIKYNYWFGDEVAFRYSKFFISDLTYTTGYGWLRYPAVFMSVLTVSMLIFMLIKKSTDNNPLKAPDNIKPFPFDNDEDFAFVGSEGKIITVDFENKTTAKSLADELFGGDSFTMDDKEYDILFTFDNEEETEKYVVYTDYSLDEEGKIQIFASKYNPKVNPEKLLSIESDEEWESIQFLLTYAMEKARENVEKSKEDQIELDTYKTITAMSEALGEQAFDCSPFVLSIVDPKEGKGSVSICGDTENALHLVNEILIAISRRLKDDGLNEMRAFELLCIMASGATDKAYEDRRRKRNPFSNIASNDETQKINFDFNSYLEEDGENE